MSIPSVAGIRMRSPSNQAEFPEAGAWQISGPLAKRQLGYPKISWVGTSVVARVN